MFLLGSANSEKPYSLAEVNGCSGTNHGFRIVLTTLNVHRKNPHVFFSDWANIAHVTQ